MEERVLSFMKLMQYPIYDEEDELIHPAMYDETFKQGKIVEVVVSVEGMHLSKDLWGTIRVHSLRMLNVNTTDYSQTPVVPPQDPKHRKGKGRVSDHDDEDEDDGGGDGGRGLADRTTQEVDVGEAGGLAQSASSFELEAAGLTDITLEGDVMMTDVTASTTSTSTPLKRKSTRAQTTANKKRKV